MSLWGCASAGRLGCSFLCSRGWKWSRTAVRRCPNGTDVGSTALCRLYHHARRGKSGGSSPGRNRLDDARMQAIAADVGYAETVFVTEAAVDGDARRNRVRYFSPIAEVPFCGHATIALAVALSGRDGCGHLYFRDPGGARRDRDCRPGRRGDGSFTSVEPRVAEFPDGFWAPCSGCSAWTGRAAPGVPADDRFCRKLAPHSRLRRTEDL